MMADPIEHFVLLMFENHSFDQMLGGLKDLCPGLDGIDEGRFNADAAGRRYFQVAATEPQMRCDPCHEVPCVAEQLEGGNGGFIRNFEGCYPRASGDDKQDVMGYYPAGFLPALHALAQEFTVCDRWYSSVPGPTWPNRFFALSGTSSGRVKMPSGPHDPGLQSYFQQNQTTLFDRLNEAGRSWRIYFHDFPSSLVLDHQRRVENLAGYRSIDHFFQDASDATAFPEFVFIEPKYFGTDQNDDHPPHNVMKAQKLCADVYNAIRSNPALWRSTLLIVTYDEHGGFYDHVTPPKAVPPDDHQEEYTFDQYGVRVPAVLISPWVGRGVVHTEFDHTSVLKYLIEKWGLGELGRRAAAAASVAEALTEVVREDTPPFIHIPLALLPPGDPGWEALKPSEYQCSLLALAEYLKGELDEATTAALDVAAVMASRWEMAVHAFGAWLERLGRQLGAPARDAQRAGIGRAQSVIARRMAATARGARASGQR